LPDLDTEPDLSFRGGWIRFNLDRIGNPALDYFRRIRHTKHFPPVVDALRENFPSILGALRPGIPFSRIKPLKKKLVSLQAKLHWKGLLWQASNNLRFKV
jgi:hypothetical protein